MSKDAKNKIVPLIRFPEFRDEWEERALREIGEFVGGGTPDTTKPEYWDGEIQWFTPTEVKNRNIEKSKRTITEKGLKNSSAKLLPKGALLITSRATIGDVGIASNECTTNQGFQSLIVNGNEVNTFWYYWLIQNKDELVRKSSGSTFPEIGKNEIVKVKALRPDKKEQQKIADCLSSLDELITAENQKLEALKAHKKGLMQQLFPVEGETVPKLRFAEFKESGDWELKELKEFITERNESPTQKIPLYSLTIEDGITPKTERYERSFLVKDEEEAYKIVHPNDFAYNPMNLRFGAIAMHVGSNCVALSKYYNIFYCDDSVDSRFCNIYFKSYGMIKHYDNVATGSLIEKRRVHFSEFLKFKIFFPSLPEQQKIATCLSSLDDLITTQAEKIEALKQHKNGLMQGLFPRTQV